MTKNKLIKALQKIKGNPEIKMWNPFVGDWMDFKVADGFEFVKESEQFIRESVMIRWRRDNKLPFSKPIPPEGQKQIDEDVQYNLKNIPWDLPNPYVPEDKMEQWYGKKRKKVVFLDPVKRGETTYDRLGKIEY